jgi:hypothetical protein
MMNLKIDSQHSSGKEYNDVTVCCEEEDLRIEGEGVVFLFLFIGSAVSRLW